MNLKNRLESENIKLPEPFYTQITAFSEHLMRWNKIHNLTGAKNIADIEENIFDALYPLTFLPSVKKAMDIGTGAGFPGLILAMALPQTNFTLVEPLQKRASFLQYIASNLKLSNVKIELNRVENISNPIQMDMITSRAVTDTNLLLRLSEKFIKKGTILLFYKGTNVKEEIDNNLDYKIVERANRRYLLIKSDR